jgi:hypothetical protein
LKAQDTLYATVLVNGKLVGKTLTRNIAYNMLRLARHAFSYHKATFSGAVAALLSANNVSVTVSQ